MARKLNAWQRDRQHALFEPRVDDGAWRPKEALPDLSQHKDVWLDTEYDGKFQKRKAVTELCGLTITLRDGTSQYMPVRHKEGGNLDESKVKEWANRELRGKKLRNINMAGDAEAMRNWGVDLEKMGCSLHDISYAAALIDEEQFKAPNLDELAAEWLGPERQKRKTGVRPQNIHLAHSSLIGEYAEEDGALARDVDIAQEPHIERDGLQAVMALEDGLIWANNHMERSMMRMDVGKLASWRSSMTAEYASLSMAIWSGTGVRLKPNSQKTWHELFCQQGLDRPKYGESFRGGLYHELIKGYTDDYLKKVIKAKPNKFLEMGLQLRRMASLESKYLGKYEAALVGDCVPFNLYQLRACEEDYGTLVGRYSSANVNIQQVFKPGNQKDKFCTCGITKKELDSGLDHFDGCFGNRFIIRELVIPDDDCDLFAVDGSQLQFRGFAHYSKDPGLIAAYNENPDIDFHNMVAEMFHMIRQAAKHNNFAMVLGMGREKLADRSGNSCNCTGTTERDDKGGLVYWGRRARAEMRARNASPEEIRSRVFGINENHASTCPARISNDMADQYEDRFPAAKKTMERVTKAAEGRSRKDSKGRGFVKSLLGRRCRYVAGDKFYSAFAALLQMSEADLVKSKIKTLYDNREVIGIKKLRFPVHDEVVGDIFKENKERNRARFMEACAVVEPGVEMRVPMIWEAKFGPNWYRMKDKMKSGFKGGN